MKTYIQEILRWATIATFGGFGAWVLYTGGQGIVRNWDGGWTSTLFETIFTLSASFLFFAVAFFCLQRQYREIFFVAGIVGSIFVFSVLISLPEWSGYHEYIRNHREPENPWVNFLGLLFSFLFLFGPIYAAAWFFRFCRCLAYRGMESNKPSQKTRATGWLVGLGFCLLFSPMIALFCHSVIVVQSSPPPSSPEFVDNWIHWSMGLGLLGIVMMFVGLVWRRPIVKQQDEPLPTSDNDLFRDAHNR